MIGSWSLPGHVDATNLEIRADGTFVWDIDGCDFGGGGEGRWRTDPVVGPPGAFIFEPPRGQATFDWMDDVTFRLPVASLRVARNGDHLSVSGDDRGKPFTQTWDPGSVCPNCGGQLGPTGQRKCEHRVGR
jgi:hypothetical protein